MAGQRDMLPAVIDVVFIAPDEDPESPTQRTVGFQAGEPIPRVGECVILAFGPDPRRWQVQDVAHIFEGGRHGIAIKLAQPPV